MQAALSLIKRYAIPTCERVLIHEDRRMWKRFKICYLGLPGTSLAAVQLWNHHSTSAEPQADRFSGLYVKKIAYNY